MDLKIVAERKPGFDEPITVKLLHNHPASARRTTL